MRVPMTEADAMRELTPLIEHLGELCVEQLIDGTHAGSIGFACIVAGAKAVACAKDEDFTDGREKAFEGLLDAARLQFNTAKKAVDDERERQREQDGADSAVSGGPAVGSAGAGQVHSGRGRAARGAEGGSVGNAEADSGARAEAAERAAGGLDPAAAIRRGFHVIH